jgi:putative effector of murein hydrolase LrgA (UPF0299 family)
MSGTAELASKALSFGDAFSDKNKTNTVTVIASVIGFAMLVTLFVLLRKNQKKYNWGINKLLATVFLLFITITAIILQISKENEEREHYMLLLSMIILLSSTSLMITVLF